MLINATWIGSNLPQYGLLTAFKEVMATKAKRLFQRKDVEKPFLIAAFNRILGVSLELTASTTA